MKGASLQICAATADQKMKLPLTVDRRNYLDLGAPPVVEMT